MKLPPLVARVRVHTPHRACRLWVPLFLLWGLLLVLLVLLLPVLAVAIGVTAVAAPRWSIAPAARGLWAVLCESRGTRVLVAGGRAQVFFTLH
ncbi:MAG TPA: hypothetical protein VLU43_01855 [Anaeromyxobacteraceae bacterium]|nr:hypothetical protein [Anaeromyxobacteraceae bacterium]